MCKGLASAITCKVVFQTLGINMTSLVSIRNRAGVFALATTQALFLAGCGGGSDSIPTAAVTTPLTNTALGCTKLSPKIGQTATLSTRAHGVTGKAQVIDDCTIEITSFSYDGGGLPDVFFYGAMAANYATGFAIGTNLFGKPQVNTTIKLTLKDKELDNLDGISLWCIRAGMSFGDGLFK
jgi:Electron transfer DM13